MSDGYELYKESVVSNPICKAKESVGTEECRDNRHRLSEIGEIEQPVAVPTSSLIFVGRTPRSPSAYGRGINYPNVCPSSLLFTIVPFSLLPSFSIFLYLSPSFSMIARTFSSNDRLFPL